MDLSVRKRKWHLQTTRTRVYIIRVRARSLSIVYTVRLISNKRVVEASSRRAREDVRARTRHSDSAIYICSRVFFFFFYTYFLLIHCAFFDSIFFFYQLCPSWTKIYVWERIYVVSIPLWRNYSLFFCNIVETISRKRIWL